MRLKYSNLLLAGLVAVTMACGGTAEKQEGGAEADKNMEDVKKTEIEAKKEREEEGFHAYDRHFQMVATSYDGVVRGVDMYASKEDVKAAEEADREVIFEDRTEAMPKAELVEETDNMLKYMLKMDEKDDATIVYHFEEGKLDSIRITVHVLTQDEFSAMEADFIQFFGHKHGDPTMLDDKREIWKVKGSDVHELDIIDKQEGDKYYLEIDVS